MNERIKELWWKARIGYNNQNCDPEVLEKFAELIVRECLSIVKSNTYGPNGEYDYSYTDENYKADKRAESIYEDIQYRFGVEE